MLSRIGIYKSNSGIHSGVSKKNPTMKLRKFRFKRQRWLLILPLIIGVTQIINVNPLLKQFLDVQQQLSTRFMPKSPIIYTFYDQILTKDGHLDDISKDKSILDTWLKFWTDAGFDARILSIEDAKRHPDYELYKASLVRKYKNSEFMWEQSFNYLTFIRWLAMASQGTGGWMSDIDVFPMGISVSIGRNLPNSGKFTAYEKQIPSLLSGTAEEWERVSHLMLHSATTEIENNRFTTLQDMMVLKEMNVGSRETIIFDDGNHVWDYPYKSVTSNKNVIDCNIFAHFDVWVVHLSTSYTIEAIEESILHIPFADYHNRNRDLSLNDRSYLARELNTLWKTECKTVINTISASISSTLNQILTTDKKSLVNHKAKKNFPIIYTFFESRKESGDPNYNVDEHENMLATWKELWSRVGWEPRVLTLDDAKKHHDYAKYKDLFFEESINSLIEKSPDSFSFVRWLAMSAHGNGGWMAHYDIIPIGITASLGLELPHNGMLTSFEESVPSLISGNADEWERASHVILEQAKQKENSNEIESVKYSDAHALHDVKQMDNGSVLFIDKTFHVISNIPYHVKGGKNNIDCYVFQVNDIWVAHLSQTSIETAAKESRMIIPDGVSMSDRQYFSWELFKLWKEECQPSLDFTFGGSPILERSSDIYPVVVKEPTNEPPKIYTFYHRARHVNGTHFDDEDMHQRRLSTWLKLWKQAGWEPKVLTINDAMRHIDYPKYTDILQTVKNYNNIWVDSQDMLCLVRWMALATQRSDGWLADYDTFPLGISVSTGQNLPNNGKFTSYQHHIPSLMSGNSEEWNFVTYLILEQAIKSKEAERYSSIKYSDSQALLDLSKENPESIFFSDTDLHVIDEYPYNIDSVNDRNIIDCHMLARKNVWAVHLSSLSIEKVVKKQIFHIPENIQISDTGYFGEKMTSQWKTECKPQSDIPF